MEDETKKERGRPRMYSSAVKLSANIPADLKDRLAAGAAAAGVSLSSYLVSVLRGAL